MQEQQKQLVERLKQAQNILVTVTANPSVDQLSAAIGLTLVLNHLGKHGTAVFSGQVPSTLEFLKPEETLEKNTDSLRDFIIALDKSKADKLRYKVEDDVVRIFITPYKTSISEKDLEFSQGDFNVDVVVALGVHQQQDLDSAITAHGRILHDATIASINIEAGGDLGTINWLDTTASSLSEMVASLVDSLDKKVLDSQISTALLTGIVATTERFRNDKTTPNTMSVSAALMAAGANQQLVATQLETPPPAPEPEEPEPAFDLPEPNAFASEDEQPDAAAEKHQSEPGTLEIEHDAPQEEEPESAFSAPAEPTPPEPEQPQVDVDDDGHLILPNEQPLPEISAVHAQPEDNSNDEPVAGQDDEDKDAFGRVMNPPERGGELTAATEDEESESASEELTLPSLNTPLMDHGAHPFTPAPNVQLPASNEPVKAEYSGFTMQPPAPTVTSPPARPQSFTEPQEPAFMPPAPELSPSLPPEPAFSLPVPTPNLEPAFSPAPPAAVTPVNPIAPVSDVPTVLPDPIASPPQIDPDETLTEIEKSVGSPHLEMTPGLDATEEARKKVDAAFFGASEPPQANAASGAQTVFDQAEQQFQLPTSPPPSTPEFSQPAPQAPPANLFQAPSVSQFPTQPANPSVFPGSVPGVPQVTDPNAPPPVPPPMLPRLP